MLTRYINFDYHCEYYQTSWSPDILFLSLFHNNTVHWIDQHGSFNISGSSSTNFRFVSFLKKPRVFIFNRRLCNKIVYMLWNFFTVASAQFFNFNTCASILTEDCYRYGNDPSCGSNGVTYRNKSVIKHHINIYPFFFSSKTIYVTLCIRVDDFCQNFRTQSKRIYFFSKGVGVGGGLV